MDAITAINTPPSARPDTAPVQDQPESDRSVLTSDFETFLRMLTTQVQNQDPLNPLDSTDFAVQLATFSGVEQQVKTNELIEAMLGQSGLGDLSAMGAWVGREVRAPAAAQFDGQPVDLFPEPPTSADRVILSVVNASGTVVQQAELQQGSGPVVWAGVASDGSPYPNGAYSFSIESFRDGNSLGVEQVDVYSRVEEVRRNGSDLQLVLAGGSVVAPDDISALREPTTIAE